MKFEIMKKEYNLKTLDVFAEIRYFEDATVNGVEDTEGDLMPCMNGDIWSPSIDIDSGVITNWEQGKKAEVHYKVCDAGSYYILDESEEEIFSVEGYVPDIMCPKGNGYGDYIKMDIDENGKILNWKFTLDGFFDED